jgi:hypothetical protein
VGRAHYFSQDPHLLVLSQWVLIDSYIWISMGCQSSDHSRNLLKIQKFESLWYCIWNILLGFSPFLIILFLSSIPLLPWHSCASVLELRLLNNTSCPSPELIKIPTLKLLSWFSDNSTLSCYFWCLLAII